MRDDAERLALPAHLRPAAAALFDDLPEAQAGAWVDSAGRRLEAGAAALVEKLPPGSEITVDAFRVRAAAGCPAAGVSGAALPFSWSPATAARTIGLRAVSYHLRGHHGGTSNGGGRPGLCAIESAVDAVVAELIAGERDRTPGPWLAGLSPPARAVVAAHARRWAEQAVAWLPLRLVGNRELRFLDDDWWPPRSRSRNDVQAHSLRVHGRRDITVEVGGRRVAVSVVGGTASGAGLAEVDALTALAALLCDPKGRLVRVVRCHPASGEVVAFDVTAPLLDRAVEVVLATACVLGKASLGAEPEAVPGPGCTWCHRREVCGPGTAWLNRPDRRSMGLPLSCSGAE